MALKLFKRPEKKDEPFLALDIGTESVKALIFTLDEERAVVKGFGEQKQGLTQMRGGTIANLPGVCENCEVAISQASLQAGVSPERVIIGLAGPTIKGFSTFFRFERTDPETKITPAEFQEIINRVQEASFESAVEEEKYETGSDNLNLKLTNSSVISVKIDNFEVPTPLNFKGKEIEIGFFSAYTSTVQLETLESLADELGLLIYSISAEPFSLVSGILPAERESLAGVILDLGGTVTDVILVKQGRILGTKVLPLGGRMISQRIADLLSLPFEEAESKKIQYSQNEIEPTLKRKIKEVVSQEVDLWIGGVERAIKNFTEEVLPAQFLICGGGASLPEIKTALLAHPWSKKLPFSQFPKIDFIVPDNVLTVFDQTGFFTDHRRVTPMSLCKVALDLEKEEDVVSRMLVKTAHKMGI
ncbi:hypothetical protein COS81_01160 [candidate division WWE3 bacterium CG06_land_8_20_14_3_00_42_16]|uniref:SHS2 domain-containing protein n=4 Tax=Katanobacteria TaxID=422282 RepID=A0A2M7AP24_UNCKA|nr:MAG: hypothetical protein AUJ38_02290 [bacterium CG1_02_42_9]PIU69151.1 MAG: hypothetical protein COS81_01160 [candidate division WWE3 bacterium CG06_land_8_20_14_3_00_42_16]PJA37302.1 MAG: hypothetical protein CO181_04070 [candidate division WWE3 bacterium CG_4_9_14_3_um_filter_43_9]PJC68044.1 MAG: hypothetical protein CO015_05420 [candidate division WWE3 bacterium CG_4_8_14_3_um_filter_42_11]